LSGHGRQEDGRGARAYLSEVENLNAVVLGFAADDEVVLVPAHLPPDGGLRVLRETPEVDELAGLADLGEGGAVGLRDGNEFPAVLARPTPGGGALSSRAAEVGVAQEVVEVDLAPED
jgi:hypothetical protein